MYRSDNFESGRSAHSFLILFVSSFPFQFREQSSADMPRGVKTFKDVLGHWNYDRDPFLPEIKKDGQTWLLELLTSRMFDSKHTTFLDLYPDKDYAQQWEQVRVPHQNECLYCICSGFPHCPLLFLAIDGSRVVE